MAWTTQRTLACVAAGAWVLCACGPGSSKEGPEDNGGVDRAPEIASFTATPESLGYGQETQVTWQWTYAEPAIPEPTCEIDGGVGEVAAGASSALTLDADAMFKLRCINSAGEDTAELALPITRVAPKLTRFTASPPAVVRSTKTMVTWSWEFDGAPYPPPSCAIDSGLGERAPGSADEVTLSDTTQYSVACENEAGSDSLAVNVRALAVFPFDAETGEFVDGLSFRTEYDSKFSRGLLLFDGSSRYLPAAASIPDTDEAEVFVESFGVNGTASQVVQMPGLSADAVPEVSNVSLQDALQHGNTSSARLMLIQVPASETATFAVFTGPVDGSLILRETRATSGRDSSDLEDLRMNALAIGSAPEFAHPTFQYRADKVITQIAESLHELLPNEQALSLDAFDLTCTEENHVTLVTYTGDASRNVYASIRQGWNRSGPKHAPPSCYLYASDGSHEGQTQIALTHAWRVHAATDVHVLIRDCESGRKLVEGTKRCDGPSTPASSVRVAAISPETSEVVSGSSHEISFRLINGGDAASGDLRVVLEDAFNGALVTLPDDVPSLPSGGSYDGSVNLQLHEAGRYKIKLICRGGKGDPGLPSESFALVNVLDDETPNAPPAIQIDAIPAWMDAGDVRRSSATAIDPEDGDISNNVQWHSSVRGLFGTGSSVSLAGLEPGLHDIVASITDSGGAFKSARATLRIAPQQSAFTPIEIVRLAADVLPLSVDADATITCETEPLPEGDEVSFYWASTSGSIVASHETPNRAVLSTMRAGPVTVSCDVLRSRGSGSDRTTARSSKEEQFFVGDPASNKDHDMDGFTPDENDCNDDPAAGGASQSPIMQEICGDGIDNDCSGTADDACGEPDPTSCQPGYFYYQSQCVQIEPPSLVSHETNPANAEIVVGGPPVLARFQIENANPFNIVSGLDVRFRIDGGVYGGTEPGVVVLR